MRNYVKLLLYLFLCGWMLLEHLPDIGRFVWTKTIRVEVIGAPSDFVLNTLSDFFGLEYANSIQEKDLCENCSPDLDKESIHSYEASTEEDQSLKEDWSQSQKMNQENHFEEIVYGFESSWPLLPPTSQVRPVTPMICNACWRPFAANGVKILAKTFSSYLPKPHNDKFNWVGLNPTSFHFAKEYYIYTLRQLLI